MSMNLYCDAVPLWQTPTDVTCRLINPKGTARRPLPNEDGMNAVRMRYIEWVRTTHMPSAAKVDHIAEVLAVDNPCFEVR